MRTAFQNLRCFRRRMRFTRCRFIRDLLLVALFFTGLTCYLSYTGNDTLPADGSRSNRMSGSSALKRSILSQLTSSGDRVVPGPYTSGPQVTSFEYRLQKLLEEMESECVHAQRRRAAVVRGQKQVVSRDLPLYQKALEDHGFHVHTPPWYRKHRIPQRNSTVYFIMDKPEKYQASPEEEEPSNWLMLLCMTFSDGDPSACFEWKDLRPHTWVNRIPGIRNVLWQKDSLSLTANLAKNLKSLSDRPPVPESFVLPIQYHDFVAEAESVGYGGQWLLKPLSAQPKIVDVFSPVGQTQIDEYSRRRAVVQRVIPDTLTVFGQPVSIRLYVLVTSLLPLRAYVHSQGIVYHRYSESRNFKKIAGRTWPLSQFWQYLSKNHGSDAVVSALRNIHTTLVHLLLLAEMALLSDPSQDPLAAHRNRCPHCFQLLGVDVVLSGNDWRAWVVEVQGQPSVQQSGRDEDLFLNNVRQTVVHDTFDLLLRQPRQQLSSSLAKTLAQVAQEHNTGVLGVNCRVTHDLCLSQQDLLFLLQSKRETLHSQGFRQLYPSVQGDSYAPVIDDIQEALNEGRNTTVPYKTAHLHHLLNSLEKLYGSQKSYETYAEEDMKLGDCCRKSNFTEAIQHWNFGGFQDARDPFLPTCSDDPSTLPYLSGVSIFPPLTLTPPFNPLVTEYSANVTYDQLMVRLSAHAQNCQTEVRIDDKYGPTRATNYTLCVGENRISFMVVDISHTEPWVINTYTLVVHRLTLTHGEPPFDSNAPHHVCSLHQECEMRVSPSEMCGIQKDTLFHNWTHYAHTEERLPVCATGDARGRWLLPCGACSERTTCFWREAVWQPYGCKHAVLPTDTLKRCLAGKKLLFIGDSTNRGMMHYVLERVNGTLEEWNKTHDIRVYGAVNSNRTALSFAYYPQFWLPTNQRPVFDKALYHLIQKSRPLENNSNTILIVGGVQWLATQHLLMMLRALRVERLQGIKLVMKTLGAGFHLPVEGVHTLSMDEHRKLLLHSQGLGDFAKHYNFEVIDTFNITVARYKDFLQGKCACHFHRVVKIPSVYENFPRWRTRRKTGPSGRPTRFHVEGHINSIYSEILLSRICADFHTNS